MTIDIQAKPVSVADRTARRVSGREDGSAMLVVMAAMAILFILSTMLITMSVFQVTQAQREEQRMKALHIADAGLNAYLAELRRNPAYGTTNPNLGPLASPDGTWTVSVTTTTGALVVRSVGTVVNARGAATSRTLVSRVAFPTYADYAILCDDYISIGADAVFIGKVRSNDYIDNSGKVFADASQNVNQPGQLWAVNTITDRTGSIPKRPGQASFIHANAPVVDFGEITGDMTIIQTTATGSGTNFAALTGSDLGYRVVLNGGTYSLSRITGGSKYSGGLTYAAITGQQNMPIPAAGVLYFNDDVWVQGTYNAMVTVASSGDIMLTQNIAPTDSNSVFTCGLVAQNNVWIPIDYPTTQLPDQLSIQAAMVAINGSCGAYFDAGGPLRSKATFIGSRSYKVATGLVQIDGSGHEVAGFSNRVYDYDERLDTYAPPKFPVIHDGTLKVTTWQEQ
jgi:type II secretory pathway pseudopilin PulG